MVRAFDRDPDLGTPLDRIGRAITMENKWRAQRYGVQASFVEPYRRVSITALAWLERLIGLLGDDDAEDVGPAQAHLREVIAGGTSADEQIRIYQGACTEGHSEHDALRAVIAWAARVTAG
jgi:carboxylate-amine ligase